MLNEIDKIFLTAEWKHLVIINYLIDPVALRNYVPRGAKLDIRNGNCYLSLVGFRFINTKIKGIPIPFHMDFEEINLRFYVYTTKSNNICRGVVFIKEIVPKKLVAIIANTLYNENYIRLKTSHSIDLEDNSPNRHVTYSWQLNKEWNSISLVPKGSKYLPASGSEAEFITEHYWGYSSTGSGETILYQVQHPKWHVWDAETMRVNVNFVQLYGSVLGEYLSHEPYSALIAEGSVISVSHCKKQYF